MKNKVKDERNLESVTPILSTYTPAGSEVLVKTKPKMRTKSLLMNLQRNSRRILLSCPLHGSLSALLLCWSTCFH